MENIEKEEEQQQQQQQQQQELQEQHSSLPPKQVSSNFQQQKEKKQHADDMIITEAQIKETVENLVKPLNRVIRDTSSCSAQALYQNPLARHHMADFAKRSLVHLCSSIPKTAEEKNNDFNNLVGTLLAIQDSISFENEKKVKKMATNINSSICKQLDSQLKQLKEKKVSYYDQPQQQQQQYRNQYERQKQQQYRYQNGYEPQDQQYEKQRQYRRELEYQPRSQRYQSVQSQQLFHQQRRYQPQQQELYQPQQQELYQTNYQINDNYKKKALMDEFVNDAIRTASYSDYKPKVALHSTAHYDDDIDNDEHMDYQKRKRLPSLNSSYEPRKLKTNAIEITSMDQI